MGQVFRREVAVAFEEVKEDERIGGMKNKKEWFEVLENTMKMIDL